MVFRGGGVDIPMFVLMLAAFENFFVNGRVGGGRNIKSQISKAGI